ncbi:MAG: hypothetical protein FWD47_09915 [Treponema sp.]|nr:hypothetical protein [Treponema sp.]
MKNIYFIFLLCFFSIFAFGHEDQNRSLIETIIIDPAHGGRDSGAVGKHIIDDEEKKNIIKNNGYLT